jgi:hypothetical protein
MNEPEAGSTWVPSWASDAYTWIVPQNPIRWVSDQISNAYNWVVDQMYNIMIAILIMALALAVFKLFRKWIDELINRHIKIGYEKTIEEFKSDLNRNCIIDIEEAKARLNAAAMEHEVRFTKLHIKRVNAIAEIHRYLTVLLSCLEDYTRPFEPVGIESKAERGEKLSVAHKEFVKIYSHNKLFLPKEIADKLDKINQGILVTSNMFHFNVELREALLRNGGNFDTWARLLTENIPNIRAIMNEIENDFRGLLTGK